MNVDIAVGGQLLIAPPRSRPGDAIVVRAEMDLAIALSACPASTCNGGLPPRPLAFEAPLGLTHLSPWDTPPARTNSLGRCRAILTLDMSVLAPTPTCRLLDARGRPYFLWDEDMTADELRTRLSDPDPEVRAYFLGKLMRQAKPDDVFSFVSLREILDQFSAVQRYLGRSCEFWSWLIERWGKPTRGPG